MQMCQKQTMIECLFSRGGHFRGVILNSLIELNADLPKTAVSCFRHQQVPVDGAYRW